MSSMELDQGFNIDVADTVHHSQHEALLSPSSYFRMRQTRAPVMLCKPVLG